MKNLIVKVLGLLMGFSLGLTPWGVAQAQSPDPGATGPLAVTSEEYDFGDLAFTPVGSPGPVELRAVVHHPSDLSGGPFPLVMFVHGLHAPCYQRQARSTGSEPAEPHPAAAGWPCSAGFNPIPSYRGYDYVGQAMASNGFIVVSISVDGINGLGGDLTLHTREQLMQKHLDILKMFNTTGGEPFGTKFIGKIDFTRLGTAGHSIGGEAVISHYTFNLRQPSPYQIGAVLAIAPADDLGLTINNVPFGVLLSYCDGDRGLIGVHYFDRSRYNVPGDPSPKHVIMVKGGNHNFYNTIWTPSIFPAESRDDGQICDADPRTGRLTPSQQQKVARAYISAFFRVYLKNELQFLPLVTGAAPPPASASFAEVFVSYLPPDDPALRLDVNRLLDAGNLSLNTLGGAATQSDLDPYTQCGGAGEPPNCLQVTGSRMEPHTGDPGLSQLQIGWSGATAVYQNDLPAGSRDVSRFDALQFRASVNFEDTRNKKRKPQDFSVELMDGTGKTSAVEVSEVSSALYFPPGGTPRVSPDRLLPSLFLNGVRIPLAAFSGISLHDVRSIRFKFDQKPHGAIVVSDIAFVADATNHVM